MLCTRVVHRTSADSISSPTLYCPIPQLNCCSASVSYRHPRNISGSALAITRVTSTPCISIPYMRARNISMSLKPAPLTSHLLLLTRAWQPLSPSIGHAIILACNYPPPCYICCTYFSHLFLTLSSPLSQNPAMQWLTYSTWNITIAHLITQPLNCLNHMIIYWRNNYMKGPHIRYRL